MLNKIYDENVEEIVAVPDGVVLVIHEDDRDGMAVLAYKFYSFRSKKLYPVTRDVYLRGKFGENYAALAEKMPDYVNYRVTALEDGRLVCVHPEKDAAVFSAEGEELWRGKIHYKDFCPSDAQAIGRTLWVSFPDGDTILRFNLRTMREELRIGSKRDGAFSRPCGLAEANGKLIVCNTVSKCIETVDPESYVVERFATFDEPVYQYVRSGNDSVVLLGSGVYIL